MATETKHDHVGHNLTFISIPNFPSYPTLNAMYYVYVVYTSWAWPTKNKQTNKQTN